MISEHEFRLRNAGGTGIAFADLRPPESSVYAGPRRLSWDPKGRSYLDFLSGIGVNALGHAHPAIQKVLKRQAGRLIHVSNLFFHEYQAEFAKRLTKDIRFGPGIFL